MSLYKPISKKGNSIFTHVQFLGPYLLVQRSDNVFLKEDYQYL